MPPEYAGGVGNGHEGLQAKVGLTPRSYQLEMLEESMQRNVIVAMDTGSGKTLIAILRIQAELERCAVNKMIWFCVPTVALAQQQYVNISRQLSSYHSRVLSGKDNCEFWTKKTWTEVLEGTRIIVSTHSILLDALVHGFIRLNQISLLVFDEAHKVTKDHPANKIMQNFYHPAPSEHRPCVLGLSASPVINNKPDNLDILESNLNSISKTPKLHRSELVKHVHKPELVQLIYRSYNYDYPPASRTLMSLRNVYDEYDLSNDPWIIRMKSETDPSRSRSLMNAIMKQKTWCREQLRDLYQKAKAIAVELGTWATDIFIQQCIEKFRSNRIAEFTIQQSIENDERHHLQSILDQIENPATTWNSFDAEYTYITPKVQVLINFLKEQDTASFVGLIFVKTRVEVAMLSHILMLHPLTSTFAISTFVGESSSPNRKLTLGELADTPNQKTTLDDLRYGVKNLVVTTNALEEGIDVAACNVVICFEKPPNLKSFVQRRGRARQEVSKYAIMLEGAEGTMAVSKWQELEELMRAIYQDEMRQLKEIEKLESEEPEGNGEFSIAATGAKIGFSDAVSHLYHFCDTLTADSYVERAPMFFYETHSITTEDVVFSAKVVLPCSVDNSVREARSRKSWRTQKNAKRDAAFEAYVSLYHAGLINDHLLPELLVDPKEEEDLAAIEKRPNLAEVDQQINLWLYLAEKWQNGTDIFRNTITVDCDGFEQVELDMFLPLKIPDIEPFRLYWKPDVVHEITLKKSIQSFNLETVEILRKSTVLLLESVFGTRMSNTQDDFIALFVPALVRPGLENSQDWLDRHSGSVKASEINLKTSNESPWGLIRDLSHNKARYILQNLVSTTYHDAQRLNPSLKGLEEVSNASCLLLEVERFPKRVDFLHPIAAQDAKSPGQGLTYLLADTCEMDNLPWPVTLFASFVPSILHVIHRTMVVNQLCTELLAPLDIQDRNLVATAISAPSAHEPTDYQRLEFLGDSILKFLTSRALMAGHLIYDEGRLSRAKDRIVSNGSLSVAAIKMGLSPFILTKAFTGKKWSPLYVSTILAEERLEERREMSTKILADVVESLIGAAFQDGDISKAVACLNIFLPRVDWTKVSEGPHILYEHYDRKVLRIPPFILQSEELIGHSFHCKSLIMEALTHASFCGQNRSDSYQRLEFLGDSILDNIVTTQAFHQNPPIPVHRLHLVRTALVNGHFLGYLCMNLSSSIPRTDTRVTAPKSVERFQTETSIALWQFMRHSNTAMGWDQASCLDRYEKVKDKIATALDLGAQYPWVLLAWLDPPKPFSDVIESIIAAIWIDSRGSLAACTNFLERLGLIPYLRQVLESEDLALLHPKEELGQLADKDKVGYVVAIGEEAGEKKFTCRVSLNDREIVSVGDGLTKIEIETRAADEASKVLKREGRSLGKKRNKVDDAGREDDSNEEERDEEDDAHASAKNDEDIEQGSKGKKRKMDDGN